MKMPQFRRGRMQRSHRHCHVALWGQLAVRFVLAEMASGQSTDWPLVSWLAWSSACHMYTCIWLPISRHRHTHSCTLTPWFNAVCVLFSVFGLFQKNRKFAHRSDFVCFERLHSIHLIFPHCAVDSTTMYTLIVRCRSLSNLGRLLWLHRFYVVSL